MKDTQAQKKHKKALARKKIVAQKKVKKKKQIELSKKQVDQGLANLDVMESQRRIAILEFLVEKGFTEPKKKAKEDEDKPVFMKSRAKYLLKKLNYNEDMKDDLGDEIGKVQGLYMITDTKTEMKGIVFQVRYNAKDKKFSVKTVVEQS